jgi:outer membrane protein assembly factor BamB
MQKTQLITLVIPLFVFFSCTKDKVPVVEIEDQHYEFLDTKLHEYNNSTIVGSDGNILICGSWNGGVFVSKTTKSGNEIWRKEYATGSDIVGSTIVEMVYGDLYMLVKSISNGNPTILYKMNSLGDTLWTKEMPDNGPSHYQRELMITADGNLLLTSVLGFYPSSTYVYKIDSSGHLLNTSFFLSDEVVLQVQEQNGSIS